MKLLILSMVLFLGSVVAFYVTLPENAAATVPHTSMAQEPEAEPDFRPVVSANSPIVTAKGVIVLDIVTNTALYEKNADELVAPASVTKMMTALLASELYDNQMVVTVPYFKIDGQKMGLFSGERISVESLLYGTLVDSANDAAEVLARIFPEGRQAFIDQMNIRAKEIGMKRTTFRNPSGLDQEGHLSTARDMALLGQEIMRHQELRQIVGTTSASVTSVDGKSMHHFSATNMLLSTVPGVEGIKTGWTEVAHENLVTYINRMNHPTIIALFGSDDRFGETKSLIDWIYTSTRW